MCSASKLNATTVEVSCSTIYADSTYDPIYAVFTLYVDGNNHTTFTPQRTSYNSYTYASTSTFTADYADSSIYECVQTFGHPTEIQDPYIAMNEPTFRHSCVTSGEIQTT